jgi:phage repressor protein C with HTH and peptisase S24 domain
MKTFPERVRYCAEQAGGQSALARAVSDIVGRTVKPQIIQYLCNLDLPKPARGSKYTHAIAQAAGVNPNWLANGVGDPDLIASDRQGTPTVREPSIADIYRSNYEAEHHFHRLPKFNAVGSAGRGRFPPDYDEVIDQLTLSGPWMRKNLSFTSIDNLAVLTAYGDSMENTFSSGDALLVDCGVNEIKIDAVYVMLRNDELYIKRVQRQLNGSLKIISDNKNYESQVLENGDRENTEVLGRVVYCWNGRRL